MKQNKNRKILSFMLLLMLLGVCATSILYVLSYTQTKEKSEAETTKHYVAVIVKSTDSAFWKSVSAGVNAASTEYNLTVTFEGPKNEEDYEAQNALIEKAVKNGAEVIIFSAVDYNANADAINAAAKQGVKIIVIDSDVNSSQVSCHIGTDNYKAGIMAGKAALTSKESNLKVGIVNFDKKTANGQQREMGLREALGADKRVEILDAINVISTEEDAKKGTLEMLKKHPDINTIATFNEWTSLGVGDAIRELGIGDKTTVVAFDSNVVSVGMLETGEVDALIVQNPFAMGYLGIESAYNLINGIKLPKDKVDTATTLVTRDNMFDDEYQRILFPFD